MSHKCPSCHRDLYDRRSKSCGFCGAPIPASLQFTPEEIALLDHKIGESEQGIVGKRDRHPHFFSQSFLVLLIVGVCGMLALRAGFSRTRQFRAKARSGQPIVRAIEDFRKDTGAYPVSLVDLAPKYLSSVPETADWSHDKYDGWDYCTVTNGESVTYILRYYMGRGGVEYMPPVWSGNDEGHWTVLLKNK